MKKIKNTEFDLELTDECRDTFIETIAEKLDTRDKRWMFLKLTFPDFISRIQIEGSAYNTAWNIYSEFEKQQMLGSLLLDMSGKWKPEILL